MTYKILTDDIKKVIYHFNILVATKDAPNYHLDPFCEEDIVQVVKSRHDNHDINIKPNTTYTDFNSDPTTNSDHPSLIMPGFEHDDHCTVLTNPSDLVGHTFLMEEQADGQHFHASIVECIDDHQNQLSKDPQHIKFRCSINDDAYEDILSYQEIMDYINKDEEDPVYWKFKHIMAHEGPLDKSSPSYQGSKYNVMIEWENGEITTEPLSIIAADDPVSCAIYARDNKLLNTDGCQYFKCTAKHVKLLQHHMNQAKLQS